MVYTRCLEDLLVDGKLIMESRETVRVLAYARTLTNQKNKKARHISIGASLLLSEYRRGFLRNIRNYAFMVLIFSLVLTFFALPAAYYEFQTVAYRTANYDISLSGPITKTDVQKLKAYKGTQYVLALSDFTTDIWSQSNHIVADVYLVDNISIASEALLVNKKLLVQGSFEPNACVLPANLASSLKVGIGDFIDIKWESFKLKSTKGKSLRYRVSGIVYPNTQRDIIVADASNKEQFLVSLKKAIDQENRMSTGYSPKYSPDYEAAFIKLKSFANAGSEGLLDQLGSKKNELIFETRQQALKSRINEAAKLGQSYQFWFLQYGALALYLFLFLGNSLKNIDLRQKLYAILSAIGANRRLIIIHNALDSLITNSAILIFSIYITKLYFRYFLTFYLPAIVVYKVIGIALLVNLFAFIISSVIANIKLSKIEIARLLRLE